jgi:hypothetical protein
VGSRSIARATIWLAVPCAIRSLDHCSSATGEITEVIAGFPSSVDCTSFIWVTLPVVNRSTTVLPSGTVNSTTMFSPPNRFWYALLSAATCDPGSM